MISRPLKHRSLAALLSALVLLAAGRPAGAVVVLLKGGKPPIKAALVREDTDTIVVRQTRADGSTYLRQIPRAEIDEVLVTVSPQRLAELAPDNPSAYRDYADELAEKREDPDAREAAIRLYLIAAWLDPPRLGRACLLGMAGLARSAAEERKFRAMAFLLDPEHDRRLLQAPDVSAGPAASERRELPASVLKPIRLLRQGKADSARMLAERGYYRKQFAQFEEFLSFDEFMRACREYRRKPPPSDLLGKLLQIELVFSGDIQPVGEAAAAAPVADTWSDAVRMGRMEPMPALSLESLTDLDPRKCLYRDGQWVAPSG